MKVLLFFTLFSVILLSNVALVMAALPNPLGDEVTIPSLVDKIASWLLGIGITISTIVVLWGAFLFMTSGGNQQKVTAAKQTLLYAIIGLTILLLAKGATSLISTDESGDVTVGDVNVTVPDGGGGGGSPEDFIIGDADVTPVDLSGNEAANRNKLEQAGITINTDDPTVTTLSGVIPSALDDAIRLKNACNCGVQVTAGSESHGPCTGPYCHETGHALDLVGRNSNGSYNPALDVYLSDHLTYLRDITIDGKSFPFYQGPNGTTYIREYDHWHVQYP